MYILLFLSYGYISVSQPLLNSKIEIDGHYLFRDLEIDSKYYLLPSPIKLGMTTSGMPDFKVVNLRYTGRNITADKDAKTFNSLMQYGIVIENISRMEVNGLKRKIDQDDVSITQFPLSRIKWNVINLTENESQHIDENQSIGIFESQKVTSRLDPDLAQLMHTQIKNNNLALSLNYIYYAEVAMISEAKEVDSISLENITLKYDTTIVDYPVYSDVLSFNLSQYDPYSLVINKDVNEFGSELSYPLLDVRCYDFEHELRPDLAYVQLRVEASNLMGQYVEIGNISFMNGTPSKHTLKADRVVDMSLPLRYKKEEIYSDGKTKYMPTITSDWKNIDISSDLIELGIELRKLQLEFDPSLEDMKYLIVLKYQLNNKLVTMDLIKSENELHIESEIFIDKNSSLSYDLIKIREKYNLTFEKDKHINSIDNYLYITRS